MLHVSPISSFNLFVLVYNREVHVKLLTITFS